MWKISISGSSQTCILLIVSTLSQKKASSGALATKNSDSKPPTLKNKSLVTYIDPPGAPMFCGNDIPSLPRYKSLTLIDSFITKLVNVLSKYNTLLP